MFAYKVDVEWAHTRPPTSANTTQTRVHVWARDDNDARLLATQIVHGSNPACVMVTRATIAEVEL